MTTEFTDLIRESMERFAADIRLPAGLIDRARRRHRQRRFAQGTAIVAATAALSMVIAVVTGAAGFARTERPGPGAIGGNVTGHVLTTADVVRRVTYALANDNLVMRVASPESANGQPVYCCISPGGQLAVETVLMLYQGQISYALYGVHSPLWIAGTALINGKLTQVYIDYQEHQWRLLRGGLIPDPPPNACTKSDFLNATEIGANWPSEIQSSLACGAYHVDGYAEIGGVKTIKITGSVTDYLHVGESATVTLFVNPANYLPVEVETSMTFPVVPGISNPPFQGTEIIQWLKATPANIAETLVTIPAGFQETSPGD
jgi:hypothetical protein